MDNKLIKKEEKSKKLNLKQQAFVEKMINEQLTPRDAYMAVYKVTSKTIASSNAYRLMQNPLIKTELSLLSNQLKSLAHTPKYRIMGELKEFIAAMKQDLSNPSNRKYYLEALDMVAKMEGYYQHNQTITKVNIDGNLSFGGWDPETSDSINPIEIPFEEVKVSNDINPDKEEVIQGEGVDWDPESDELFGDDDNGGDDISDMPF